MSHTETHFGKLRKVELTTTSEEFFEQRCNELGITERASYNDTWYDELRNETSKYYFIDGEVWEVFDHISGDSEDIDIMTPNEDGTITFLQQFYNGGTCLSEVIEEGLKRIKNGK